MGVCKWVFLLFQIKIKYKYSCNEIYVMHNIDIKLYIVVSKSCKSVSNLTQMNTVKSKN